MEEKISLLLVEDDETISSLLIEILSEKNFDVRHVIDGKQALDVVNEKKFDLVILDEKLPSMLGSEVLVYLKANPNTSNIPVIMLTSIDDEDYHINVLKEGADDYLTKPFKVRILLERIKTVLRRAQSKSGYLEIEISEEATPSALSKKELEVLALVVKGYDNAKIAETMFITESTVSNHLKSIYSKLKTNNRTNAAIIAIKLDLV